MIMQNPLKCEYVELKNYKIGCSLDGKRCILLQDKNDQCSWYRRKTEKK